MSSKANSGGQKLPGNGWFSSFIVYCAVLESVGFALPRELHILPNLGKVFNLSELHLYL